MKRRACVFFSIIISLFFVSGIAEGRSEVDMLEAVLYSGEIVELPENMLGGDWVYCFKLLSDGSFLLSEANRFVITDDTGSVVFHGALAHPKLRREASQIRGVGATKDGVLFAVYDYRSNSSYLARLHFDKWNITYLPVMECCIGSATMNGDHMLLGGEKGLKKGAKKRIPWASLVTLDGSEVWQYVDTSLKNVKTNITHRVKAGVVNQNVVILIIGQLNKDEKGYSEQYTLQMHNLDTGSVSKILLDSSNAISDIYQLEVDEGSAWIRCRVYDGENYNPTILHIDLSTGEPLTIPRFGAGRVAQLLVSQEKVVLREVYDDCTIISTWAKSGEYIAGVKYPQESEHGFMTIDRVLTVQDKVWAAGCITRYENEVRHRLTFFVPVE